MKRFTFKRITSLVLALIMMLSLCPVTAGAAVTAEWFLVNRFRCWDPYDGSAKVIAEVTVYTAQTIIDSEWSWNNSLDETERAKVNDAIAAQAEKEGLAVKTYDQLLAEAKENAAVLFVDAYTKDRNGVSIDVSVPEEISDYNLQIICSGIDAWNKLSSNDQEKVNSILAPLTYEEMLFIAVRQRYNAEKAIRDFLCGNTDTPYKTLDIEACFWVVSGERYWNYLDDDVKTALNVATNENFSALRDQDTTLAYMDVVDAANFMLNYLRDWNDGTLLITALDEKSSADAIRTVTNGEKTWNSLTAVQRTVVNKSLKNADANAQTYEEMLEFAAVQSFINTQLSDPNSGVLFTTATFDNADRLAVGKVKFDAMTADQQAAVRGKVSNVDDLLAAGYFIQNVLKGYDSDAQRMFNIIEIASETVARQIVYQYERSIATITTAQITMVNAALAAEQTAAGKPVQTIDELYAAAKTKQLEKNHGTAETYIGHYLSYPDGSMILDIPFGDAQYAQYVQHVVNRLVQCWQHWRDDGIYDPMLPVAEQEKVNAALAEAQKAAGKPVKTVQQLSNEAYAKYPVEIFIANTLTEQMAYTEGKAQFDPVTTVDEINFVRLFAGIDEWNRMPQFFKNEVNQRRTNANLPTYEALYAQLSETQKAEALIIMHLGGWKKDTPTVVTSREKYVAIGARYEWNYLSADGKALVNTHVLERVNKDLDAGVITQDQVKYTTYPQMLEVSLARDFVDTYLSTGNGGIITEVTADNMMRILYGVSPWYWGIVTGNGEAKTAHDWVNEELTVANDGETLTYPMLLEQALTLLYKNIAMRAPTMSDAMYDMFYKSIFNNDANAELAGLVNEMLVHGKYIDMTPFAVEVSESDVAADAAKVDAYVSDLAEGQVLSYFDLSVYVNADGSEIGAISELDEEVTFTLNIPEDQYDSDKEYVLVRIHDGVAEELETKKNNDGTLSVKTNKFSTYAVVEKSKSIGVTLTKGDVNLDGEVNADDLTALARHVAKIETLTGDYALLNADVDDNGSLSADDLTKLARYVAKIIPSL